MATIIVDPDDLAAHPYGQNKPVILSRTRKNETELPRVVGVTYANKNYDYELGHETQTRQITESRNHLTVELPIAFTPNEAAQVADILMANYWTERVSYELYLPFFKYWRVEPTDILQVTYEGATHEIRVTDIEYDIARTIKVRGVAEEQSIYTSNATGGSGELDPATVPVRGPTFAYILNLPPFEAAHRDFGGYWFGATGILSGWQSAQLFVSRDEGVTYDYLTAATDAGTIGYATSTLSNGTTTVWDTYNTVTVQMYNGTLSSDTDANVMAGNNEAYLGGEVIRFAEASLIASSTYRLSRLLRGIHGTEHAASGHNTGDEFIMLDSSVFKQVDMASTYLNVEDGYKIVPMGESINTVAVTSFTGTSEALKPFAPVHIKGSRNGARDLTITWIRRNRISGEWLDYSDIPNSEAYTRYDVEIYNGATVVRTFSSVTTASQTYTAAQQTTDFGSTQENVTVKVFQLSAAVGRGYGTRATV